jgi:hypothetical protein
MNSKKYLISIGLAIALVLPMLVSMVHSFEEHDFSICSAKAEHHIHAEKSDCSSLHFTSENPGEIPVVQQSLEIPICEGVDHLAHAPVSALPLPYIEPTRGPPYYLDI